MPRVDRDAPLRFLRTAYGPDDWIAVFLKAYDSNRTTQRVGPVSLVADPRFQAWLRAENVARSNVYVSLNAVAPYQRSQTRNVVREIRHVFLDADHEGALRDGEALTLLADWNARCEPPWSERELMDKLRRARRYGREPVGGLLETRL